MDEQARLTCGVTRSGMPLETMPLACECSNPYFGIRRLFDGAHKQKV